MVDKLFVATKAFIVHEGKVLMVRESGAYKDGTNMGKFDVVGGRVQPGERFDEGLRREVHEETGLDVTIGRPFFVNEWRPVVREEQWQIVATFFVCTKVGGDVVLGDDHSEYVWIDPLRYTEFPIIENLAQAFEAYNTLEGKKH